MTIDGSMTLLFVLASIAALPGSTATEKASDARWEALRSTPDDVPAAKLKRTCLRTPARVFASPDAHARYLAECAAMLKKREASSEAFRVYVEAARRTQWDTRLRRKVLRAARKLPGRTAKATASRKRWIEEWEAAHQRLDQIRRAPVAAEARVPEQTEALRALRRTFRAHKDAYRVRLAELERPPLLARANKLAAARKRLRRLRRRASASGLAAAWHRAEWRMWRTTDDLDQTVRAALRYNAERYRDRPEDERRYGRVPGLDRLCERYDDANGAGACTRLARRITRAWNFRDFSKEHRRGGLSTDDLARVHSQYLPSVEACLLKSARADPERFQGVSLEVEWVVAPDGRIVEHETFPGRYERDLKPCLSERLTWFRYPRFSGGERQVVAVPFRLH